ncbi:MAG TPA: GTP-binding protein, partial [Vicinamibacterales bacterium]|nr:GTP-binding protein [Vicinamibacterales bacterium]
DDGKSTLIGRLLYDSQLLLDDQLTVLERESRRYGTRAGGLDFALLVDGLAAEREQGITIDVAYRYFATARRSFIVADTPGHEQYTRNMATGASTADLAVILVDARKGLSPQTRRHSFIVSMLGVRHVVLAVNKMDLAGYSQSRFEAIVAEYQASTRDLDFTSVVGIPVCAVTGENVTAHSPAMPWYTGPHLLDHLESVEVAAEYVDSAFRFPVQWVSRPNPDFRGYAGTIVSGAVKPGTRIGIWPGGRRTVVSDIVTAEGSLARAGAGQSVTITLADDVDVSRGDVLVCNDAAVHVASALAARLLWMSDDRLDAGASFLLKLGTRTVAAKVAAIHGKVDIATYAQVAAAALGPNDIARVTLILDAPLVFTDYRQNRELGGFILIDRLSNDTVALGLVEGVPDEPRTVIDLPSRAARAVSSVRRATGALGTWFRNTREKPLRSFVKALTWRTTGSIDTFVLSFIFTGNAKLSAAISLTEIATKLALYYAHERIWAHVEFGVKRRR